METVAGIHEGFHNMQLAAPGDDLPNSFRNLATDELNTVARIYEILSSILDFCEVPVNGEPDDAFRTLCVRCVESIDLPPPPSPYHPYYAV